MDFETAASHVSDGSFQASDKVKLMFYGLYKVANQFDFQKAPNGKDPISIAKRTAWKEYLDLTPLQAQEAYIMLVEKALSKNKK